MYAVPGITGKMMLWQIIFIFFCFNSNQWGSEACHFLLFNLQDNLNDANYIRNIHLQFIVQVGIGEAKRFGDV